MTDTTVIEEKPPESPPAELPAAAQSDSWDQVQTLLDEYDSKTHVADSPEPEPQQTPASGIAAVATSELDRLLAGLDSDSQRITDLEAQLNSARSAELERQSRADFDSYSSRLQKECGPHVAEDFAVTELKAALVDKPDLHIAWNYRHVTNDQLRAADRELREVEALYISAQQAPDGDPRKQQAIAMLEQRGLQLGYMLNARTMLNNARRAVIAKARKAPPEIDWAVSADRDLIVQSLKGASAPHDFKQPPPPFGRMSDAEFRNYTKDNYGF